MASHRRHDRRLRAARGAVLGLTALSAVGCMAPPAAPAAPLTRASIPSAGPSATAAADAAPTPAALPSAAPSSGAPLAESDLPPDAQRLLWSLPNVIPHTPGAAVLPGYHVEVRRRTLLLAGGAGLLGSAFPGNLWDILMAGDGSFDNGGTVGWIPVAGPLLLIGYLDFSRGFSSGFYAMLFVIHAATQGTGLGMLIAGAAGKDVVQVRGGHAREPEAPALRFDAGGPVFVF